MATLSARRRGASMRLRAASWPSPLHPNALIMDIKAVKNGKPHTHLLTTSSSALESAREVLEHSNQRPHQLSSWFQKKNIFNKLPILQWLPKYTLAFAISDFIAGLTVGLTVIPQGIAYALVAELEPQYGLYSAFMGCFVYILFGSSKDITVGPTAIMALMTAHHANKGPAYVVLLTFLSGILIFLMGLFKLGFVIDFISVAVIAGFTSAAAITIAFTQVKSLFGLTMSEHCGVPGLSGTIIDLANNAHTVRYQDAVLGIVCLLLLLALRHLKEVHWLTSEDRNLSPTLRKSLEKSIWFVSTARNAIIVVLSMALAYFWNEADFRLTGSIEAGLPPFGLPPFSTEEASFTEMISELGSAIVIIPLIAILENVAIAKAFAKGRPVDASQEMMALGLCNLSGSFFSSMPTTGSFSRTAVNSASGVCTPLGGLYTGALVLTALAVLMPLCAFIPKATLAAVIISAVVFSVEFHVVKPMAKTNKGDLLAASVTFVVCLFWELEFGVLFGVGVQVLLVLYATARPQITMELVHFEASQWYVLVQLDRALVFPSVSHVRSHINKCAAKLEALGGRYFVLDCTHVFSADYTAAKGLEAMSDDFRRRGQHLLLINVRANVQHALEAVDLDVALEGDENALRERFKAANSAGV